MSIFCTDDVDGEPIRTLAKRKRVKEDDAEDSQDRAGEKKSKKYAKRKEENEIVLVWRWTTKDILTDIPQKVENIPFKSSTKKFATLALVGNLPFLSTSLLRCPKEVNSLKNVLKKHTLCIKGTITYKACTVSVVVEQKMIVSPIKDYSAWSLASPQRIECLIGMLWRRIHKEMKKRSAPSDAKATEAAAKDPEDTDDSDSIALSQDKSGSDEQITFVCSILEQRDPRNGTLIPETSTQTMTLNTSLIVRLCAKRTDKVYKKEEEEAIWLEEASELPKPRFSVGDVVTPDTDAILRSCWLVESLHPITGAPRLASFTRRTYERSPVCSRHFDARSSAPMLCLLPAASVLEEFEDGEELFWIPLLSTVQHQANLWKIVCKKPDLFQDRIAFYKIQPVPVDKDNKTMQDERAKMPGAWVERWVPHYEILACGTEDIPPLEKPKESKSQAPTASKEQVAENEDDSGDGNDDDDAKTESSLPELIPPRKEAEAAAAAALRPSAPPAAVAAAAAPLAKVASVPLPPFCLTWVDSAGQVKLMNHADPGAESSVSVRPMFALALILHCPSLQTSRTRSKASCEDARLDAEFNNVKLSARVEAEDSPTPRTMHLHFLLPGNTMHPTRVKTQPGLVSWDANMIFSLICEEWGKRYPELACDIKCSLSCSPGHDFFSGARIHAIDLPKPFVITQKRQKHLHALGKWTPLLSSIQLLSPEHKAKELVQVGDIVTRVTNEKIKSPLKMVVVQVNKDTICVRVDASAYTGDIPIYLSEQNPSDYKVIWRTAGMLCFKCKTVPSTMKTMPCTHFSLCVSCDTWPETCPVCQCSCAK